MAIAPINRALCEVFVSSVFTLADVEQRWPLFERGGWWENQSEYHRLSRYFRNDSAYREWLREFRQELIVEGGKRIGITSTERAKQKAASAWPNPSRMFDLACPAKNDKFGVRRGLLAVRDLIYSDLSQKAHLTFLGFVKQGRPSLMTPSSDDNLSPSISQRHQSGELFITLTLVSVLLSWTDRVFDLGAADRVRSTWRILTEYDPVSREVYRAWYPDGNDIGLELVIRT